MSVLHLQQRLQRLSHQPWPVWMGMAGVVGWSWAYLVGMSQRDVPWWASICSAWALPGLSGEWGQTVMMWCVMMVAMMVPSTVQGLVVFGAMHARRRPAASTALAGAVFIGGYVAAWSGYAVLASATQIGLGHAALLTPALRSANPALSSLVLTAAGLFQFSSLKQACLTQCRSPLGFFLSSWRDGLGGAFAMGLHHGAYCVGCCWALMAVMWVMGVMNLLWMAILALFVLAEKTTPAHWQLSRLAGAAFLLAALAHAVTPFLA